MNEKNRINSVETRIIEKSAIMIFSDQIHYISDILDSLKKMNPIDNTLVAINDQIQKNLALYLEEFIEIKHILQKDYQQEIYSWIEQIMILNQFARIGSGLLNKRLIETPIYKSTIINSISQDYWKKIRDNILNIDRFSLIKKKLKKYYRNHLDKKIKEELKKVPIDIDERIKNEYIKYYYKKEITFQEFLNINEKDESSKRSKQELDNKGKFGANTEELRRDFEAALEKKKIEQQKRKQEESFDNYERYFNMSERELRRAKRSKNQPRRRVATTSQRRRKYQNKNKGDK